MIIQVSHQGYKNWRKQCADNLRRERATRKGLEWWRQWRVITLPPGVFVGPAASGDGCYVCVDISTLEPR